MHGSDFAGGEGSLTSSCALTMSLRVRLPPTLWYQDMCIFVWADYFVVRLRSASCA